MSGATDASRARLDAAAVLFFLCSMSAPRRIPEDTAAYSRWLAERFAERRTEIRVSPSTALFIAMALETYARHLEDRQAEKLTFKVVDVVGGTEEVQAAANNVSAAWEALRALIPHRPHGKLLLRQGARILGRYPDEQTIGGMPIVQIEETA